MEKIFIQNLNGGDIKIAAHVYFPNNFDPTQRYPAIVVSHPGGGVKEQASGLYAQKLAAAANFITIAYDASFQGESTGLPRQLENPHVRTEDISAVIDYLTTLAYVDAQNIGAIGICAGAGYSANAAINDRRIKALGTVSMVNIGQMFRNGWENTVQDHDTLPLLAMGSAARSEDAQAMDLQALPLAPMTKEDAPNSELEEAWEYYHTDRAQYPTAPGFATARSLSQIISYDAYNKAEAFFTQPLLMIVGSNAGSAWMSDDLLNSAATADKTKYVVEGANHMSLYDVENYVNEAAGQLAPFFKSKLK